MRLVFTERAEPRLGPILVALLFMTFGMLSLFMAYYIPSPPSHPQFARKQIAMSPDHWRTQAPDVRQAELLCLILEHKMAALEADRQSAIQELLAFHHIAPAEVSQARKVLAEWAINARLAHEMHCTACFPEKGDPCKRLHQHDLLNAVDASLKQILELSNPNARQISRIARRSMGERLEGTWARAQPEIYTSYLRKSDKERFQHINKLMRDTRARHYRRGYSADAQELDQLAPIAQDILIRFRRACAADKRYYENMIRFRVTSERSYRRRMAEAMELGARCLIVKPEPPEQAASCALGF